jgi:hypothetical protein
VRCVVRASRSSTSARNNAAPTVEVASLDLS